MGKMDEHRDGDIALRLLTKIIDQTPGTRYGITLTVGGTQISGHLVSAEEWMNEVAATLEGDALSDLFTTLATRAAERRERNRAEEVTEDTDPDRAFPRYIHLLDARTYYSDQAVVPTSGAAWRGRISTVDGFTLGVLAEG